MLSRLWRLGAGVLLAGSVLALGSGCADDKKPLEQLSEQDASKKANDMFREKMGQMGKGASGSAPEVRPASAPGAGMPGGPPPGVQMPVPPGN